MNPNLNGPECAPLLNPIEILMVKVVVLKRNKKDDIIIREETVDFSNRQHRIWIGKLTAWAIMQDYVVETSGA